MTATIYWIEGPWSGKLAIVPRPRGGDWLEDEVRHWQQSGLDVIVSLLTVSEIEELSLPQETSLCQNAGILFLSLPIEDRGVPLSQKAVLEFSRKLVALLSEGKNIGIHCRQSVGRSALLVACLLVVAGIPPNLALQRVATTRGCPVPDTEEQRQWISDFAHYVTTHAESPRGQSAAP